MSITILVFILDRFQEKLMTNFFKKSKKNLFWGHLEPILPKFGQKKLFREKKGFCRFLSVPILNHFAETQKKTNHPFLRKMPNWRIDEQTQTTVIIKDPPLDGSPKNYLILKRMNMEMNKNDTLSLQQNRKSLCLKSQYGASVSHVNRTGHFNKIDETNKKKSNRRQC